MSIAIQSALICTDGPNLVRQVAELGATQIIVVGQIPEEIMEGVHYIHKDRPFPMPFDLFASDTAVATAFRTFMQNRDNIRHFFMRGVEQKNHADISQIGFTPHGRLLGECLWQSISETNLPPPSKPRRVIRKTKAKTVWRKRGKFGTRSLRETTLTFIDLPCVYRGEVRGSMFDGTGRFEVRDCLKHRTCWEKFCKSCEDRQP